MGNRSPLLNVIFQSLNNVTRSMLRDFGEIENLQVSPNSLEQFVSKTEKKISQLKEDRLEMQMIDAYNEGLKELNRGDIFFAAKIILSSSSKGFINIFKLPPHANPTSHAKSFVIQ